MEVGLGEVNLQIAMSKNFSISKTPILTIFARKKGAFLRVQKYTNFQYVKELFLIRIFTDCKFINCSGLAQQKMFFSEKKRVFVVHDHINGHRLPDNLH